MGEARRRKMAGAPPRPGGPSLKLAAPVPPASTDPAFVRLAVFYDDGAHVGMLLPRTSALASLVAVGAARIRPDRRATVTEEIAAGRDAWKAVRAEMFRLARSPYERVVRSGLLVLGHLALRHPDGAAYRAAVEREIVGDGSTEGLVAWVVSSDPRTASLVLSESAAHSPTGEP